MSEDCEAVVERILSDLDAVFKRDQLLDEFGIIPCFQRQNKSPVVHVEHKLGLEDWCVKPLYMYTYKKLVEWKRSRKREEPERLHQWSRAALLLNPEVSTFWNVRKNLVLSGQLPREGELQLSLLALTRKPKSAECLNHRRWLLLHSGEERTQELALEEESRAAILAASRYANNYHAWSYLGLVVRRLLPQTTDPFAACMQQWRMSRLWVQAHVSDHSGMHFRQLLVDTFRVLLQHHCPGPGHPDLEDSVSSVASLLSPGSHEVLKTAALQCPPSIFLLGLLSSELSFVSELTRTFPGHESLWYHRRFLLVRLTQVLREVSSGDGPDLKVLLVLAQAATEALKANETRFTYLQEEVEVASSSSECSENKVAQHSNMAVQHRKWLESILCL